jgi:hypothetical protein
MFKITIGRGVHERGGHEQADDREGIVKVLDLNGAFRKIFPEPPPTCTLSEAVAKKASSA